MKRVMSAVALAILAAGGVAAAQEAPRVIHDLTRAEAKAKAADRFDKLDANHDGKLDETDRAARKQRAFDRIDADHNGQISREEFAAARWHGRGGSHGRWHGRGHEQGEAPDTAHAGRWGGPRHDGPISKDAFVAAALARFDADDTNHDGVLTGTERQAARAKWHTAHAQWREHEQGDSVSSKSPAG